MKITQHATISKLGQQFSIASKIALFGWAVLILLPHWKYSDPLVTSLAIVLLAGIYIYVLFLQKNISSEHYPPGSFSSFQGVLNLFQNPKSILAAWIHILAFDLLAAVYIKQEANLVGMSHWVQIPCLLLTLLFGPAGFLLFFALKMMFY